MPEPGQRKNVALEMMTQAQEVGKKEGKKREEEENREDELKKNSGLVTEVLRELGRGASIMASAELAAKLFKRNPNSQTAKSLEFSLKAIAFYADPNSKVRKGMDKESELVDQYFGLLDIVAEFRVKGEEESNISPAEAKAMSAAFKQLVRVEETH